MKKYLKSTLTPILVMLAFMTVSCGGNSSDNHSDASSNENAAVKENRDAKAAESAEGKKPVISGKPSVLDFYATWCGPCKQIAPLFNMLKGEYGEKINFISIDVDQDVETAAKYNIEAMPTFVFLDADGNEVDRIVGADREMLSAMVDKMASLESN